jgi:uncharacterized oligopeptide transporter (OPT) family protein
MFLTISFIYVIVAVLVILVLGYTNARTGHVAEPAVIVFAIGIGVFWLPLLLFALVLIGGFAIFKLGYKLGRKEQPIVKDGSTQQ